MPDSEPDQPRQGEPTPGTPAVPNPTEPPADTLVERGLFPGLLDGGDDDGGSPPPPTGPRKKKARSEMGFLEHLEELRATIVKSLFAIFAGMAVMGIFIIKFLDFLRWPLNKALGTELANNTIISPLEPMAVVSMIMSVSIYGGAILALPVVGYFVVQFVAPGLTLREKGMLRPALWSALILFLVGVLSCFFIMLPAGLYFSYHISAELLHFKTFWSASSYYSLVVWATLATGLIFEFPLIMVIVQVLGIVEPGTLRRSRRYAVVIIAVVGGLIAPSPDPASMITMMIPMLVLYEGAIIVGERLRKRRLAAQARAEAENAG